MAAPSKPQSVLPDIKKASPKMGGMVLPGTTSFPTPNEEQPGLPIVGGIKKANKKKFNLNMLDDVNKEINDMENDKPLVSSANNTEGNKNDAKFLISDHSVPQIANDLALSDFES